MATTRDQQDRGDATSSVAMQISGHMTRVYKDLFGRGPKNVRTHFVGSDLILCTLTGTLTPAERAMVEMGEHQRLRDTRLYFQFAMEDTIRGGIEEIVGRRVVAFTSAMDTKADIDTEAFYLEPEG
jgi:uncharacterized protein YbcI